MPTLRERIRGFKNGLPAAENTPVDPDNEPQQPTGERHDLADDPAFNKVAELHRSIDSETGTQKPIDEYIRYFDPAVVEQVRTLQIEFTLEELEALVAKDDPDNPDQGLADLLEARRTLDQTDGNVRWLMDGPERRQAKKDRQIAQETFEFHKTSYLIDNSPELDQLDNLGRLTIARARFAEQTFASRHGRLRSSNDTNEHSLQEAEEAYAAARIAYLEQMYNEFGQGMTRNELTHLRASLNDHENGALAGEEANHYLTEVNDDDKKSRFQKITESYNRLNRPTKIAVMMGAGAVVGLALTSFAGGLAAAGAVYSARFARGYFGAEADRVDKQTRTSRAQQENSVTYAGSFDESRSHQTRVAGLVSRTAEAEDLQRQSTVFVTEHHTAVSAARERVTHEKRWALVKAAGVTVAGALGGEVIDHFVHFDGVSGNHGDAKDSTSSPRTPDTPSPKPTETGGSPAPTTEAPAPTPNIPQDNYLFGNSAGKDLVIVMRPDQTVWGNTYEFMRVNNPTASPLQLQRLTGNGVELLRQQYGSDLNVVQVGSKYSVKLSA